MLRTVQVFILIFSCIVHSMKVNIKPLSINGAWKGRKFKTKEYDNYIEELLYLLPKKININPEELHIIFHLKASTYHKADLDNFIKPVLDILVKKEIIEDDRFINKLILEKKESDEYQIEIVEL